MDERSTKYVLNSNHHGISYFILKGQKKVKNPPFKFYGWTPEKFSICGGAGLENKKQNNFI